jgi:hypothetical protein
MRPVGSGPKTLAAGTGKRKTEAPPAGWKPSWQLDRSRCGFSVPVQDVSGGGLTMNECEQQ